MSKRIPGLVCVITARLISSASYKVSMATAAKHKLYFSARCRHCQAFLEALITTPYVREVQAICVDPSPTRPPLPPWLKSVPSLVIVGESTPRVGPGDVNNWLAERRIAGTSLRPRIDDLATAAPVYTSDLAPRPDATARSGLRNTISVTPSTSYMAPAATPGPAKLPDAISSNTPATSGMGPQVLAGSSDEGPAAYHGSEMDGRRWSDAYSFVGHVDYTAEKGYDPIVRNFELLGGSVGMSGGGAAAAPAVKRSVKEEALLRDFEAYSAQRDVGITMPVMRKS